MGFIVAFRESASEKTRAFWKREYPYVSLPYGVPCKKEHVFRARPRETDGDLKFDMANRLFLNHALTWDYFAESNVEWTRHSRDSLGAACVHVLSLYPTFSFPFMPNNDSECTKGTNHLSPDLLRRTFHFNIPKALYNALSRARTIPRNFTVLRGISYILYRCNRQNAAKTFLLQFVDRYVKRPRIWCIFIVLN